MTAVTPATAPAPLSSTIGPRFARGLWRIAAADASSGNEVELMRDGTRIFNAMIEVIEKARETLVLESYMIVSDSVGERFSIALIAAAGRGVKVRVIADWAGSRETTRAFWRTLRDGGVDVRIFNKPGFRRWLGLLPRDHRKVLVADEEVCVTGGIGLAEVWSGFVKRKKKAPWRDTAVLIRGPAAVDMARAFETMWKRANFEERRAARRHMVRRARNTATTPGQSTGAVVGIV
jgi:cardiolipin synthase A/B